MKNVFRAIAVASLLMTHAVNYAQEVEGVDVTSSHIVNPAFDDGALTNSAPTGWVLEAAPTQSKISTSEKAGGVIPGSQNHWQLWHASGALTGRAYQVLTALPTGKYALGADIVTTGFSGAIGLYAGNDTTFVASNVGDHYKVTTTVTSGELEIGIYLATTSGVTIDFDSFTLHYLGSLEEDGYQELMSMKIKEVSDWLDNYYDDLPLSAITELEDAIYEADEYEGGGNSEEEILAAMEVFDSIYNSVKNVLIQLELLEEKLGEVEALLELNYAGIEALLDAYDIASAYVEKNANFEVPEGQSTEQFLSEAIAALEAAIETYNNSQVASPDNPANYTHKIVLPTFITSKTYTIPSPWVVANVQASGDIWVGLGHPDVEREGANQPCFNSWSNNFTTMNVYQDIEGLPDGVYTVSARAITQGLGGQHAYATSSLGTAVSPDMTMVGWDTNEWETLTTDKIVVIDGNLRIGFASTSAGDINGWFQVTDFRLMYYGAATDEDMQVVWHASTDRANELLAILLSGDSRAIEEAMAEATPLAEAGRYTDACQVLSAALEASDSVYTATKTFYEGSWSTIGELRASIGEDTGTYPYAHQLLTCICDNVSSALAADDATHVILDSINDRLDGYAAYASYLIEAENTLSTIRGIKKEHIVFVKEQVIAPQVRDLTAEYHTAEVCASLLEKLQLAMKAMLSTAYTDLSEGNLTEDLVANPTIEDASATGWSIVKGNGNGPTNTGEHYDGTSSNRYLDSWSPGGLKFTAYQEILGLPDGTYRLTVAARTDGNNAWIFAAPQPLEADTAMWAASTQWAMIKNHGNTKGEIWYADSLAWVAAEGTIEAPYLMANNGRGRGWSYDTLNVEVTRHYLAIGMTTDSTLTRKPAFTGSWFGADNWSLELVEKASVQSEYNPFTGISTAKTPSVPHIIVRDGSVFSSTGVPVSVYSISGKRLAPEGLSRGIYIVQCQGIATKILIQ